MIKFIFRVLLLMIIAPFKVMIHEIEAYRQSKLVYSLRVIDSELAKAKQQKQKIINDLEKRIDEMNNKQKKEFFKLKRDCNVSG